MTLRSLAEMLVDEAETQGQYVTEDPARLSEWLAQEDPDELVREFADVLGKVSAGLALAQFSQGRTRVVLETMAGAMMLAHRAIQHAKEGSA